MGSLRATWPLLGLMVILGAGCGDPKVHPASPSSPVVPPAALLVSSIEPPHGATEVEETTKIRVRFSRTVDGASITGSTFRVIDEAMDRAVEGTITIEGPSVVAFAPRDAFRTPSVWHRVELDPGILAADGGALDGDHSIVPIPSRFCTGEGPDVDPPYFFFYVREAEAIGPTAIRLEWFPAVDVGYRTPPDEMAYAVYVGRPPDPIDFGSPRAVVDRGATSVIVRGLEPDTIYSFIVRARDLAGNEDDNEVVVAERTSTSDAPLGLTILWSADIAGALEPCG
ncbi:MAG: Ig-like domain-containing protein [Planctomycetes bacterium]|nr:Ig-like domain-containing protein [Planctomycetota bacterium]